VSESALDQKPVVEEAKAPCPVCSSVDSWRNVDEFRVKPMGMCLCMSCGVISYPEKIKNKDAVLAFYEEDYRQPPSVQNLYTSERKLQYHGAFLADVFDDWKAKGIEAPIVTDIGSAFGLFLHYVRGFFPKAEIEGVELTKSFVRTAWHCYRIKSNKDFDDSKKYDLISSYKSLEHIIDPLKELKRYIAALKDDGKLYLGIPTWFDAFRNFGMTGFDLENYYSPNHVNTWTYKHIKGMVEAAGGEIVKENRSYYDTVFLIKKSDKVTLDIVKPEFFEDPNEILEKLKIAKGVGEALVLGEYKKALDLYPNIPHAWSLYYEMNRRAFHERGGFPVIEKEVIEKAFAACPLEADVRIMAADIACRYEEYNKALEYLSEANNLRPNAGNTFVMIANTYRLLAKHSKNPEDRIKFFSESRKIALALKDLGMAHQAEAMTWLFYDSAQIPTPFEGE
jgi:SAM-dependent methyltransferase